MDLTTIWLGLGVFCIGWHFYYQRQLAEAARSHAHKYCEQQGIQFISIAKISSGLMMVPGKGVRWKNRYLFEFSGDGQSKYEGTLTLLGNQVQTIETPVYKVN